VGKNTLIRLIGILFFCLLGVGSAIFVIYVSNLNGSGDASTTTPLRRVLRENTPAPDFTLPTIDGGTFKLSDYKGKRIMINFWASWCPPCLAETPDLVLAYHEVSKLYGNEIMFVGVGVNDDISNLKKFAEINQVPYVVPYDKDSIVADAYGVVAMPITVFVDANGSVYRKTIGSIKKQQVIDIFIEMSRNSK
jgi:peroxiredoxin